MRRKAGLQAIARVDDAFQKGDVKACAVLVAYLNKPVRPDGKPGAIGYLTPVFEKQGGPWMLAFTQSPDLQAPARPRRRRQARCSRWCRGRPDRTVP